jgi:hypothetical protein
VVLSGYPASPTTKTGCHDIAEILLKVAINTNIQIQIQILKPRIIIPKLEFTGYAD